MHRLRALTLTACVLIAVPASARTMPPAALIENLAKVDARVAQVGFRLLTANVARCPSRMPATGLVLHSLFQYRGPYRAAALDTWTFPAAVSVAVVIPQSPAARAGLHSGDGLIRIAGMELPQSLPGQAPTTWLRDDAESRLAALPPAAPIALTIRRGEQNLPITVEPIPACRSRIEVAPGLKSAAQSDGATIQLGQAFAERSDDDGLAVAIAHELAHTILEHRQTLRKLESDGLPTKGLARAFEDDADMLSLELLAAAGWNPMIAPRFMRREGRRYDPVIPGSGKHRSAEDRARRMEQRLQAPPFSQCRVPGNRSEPCIAA